MKKLFSLFAATTFFAAIIITGCRKADSLGMKNSITAAEFFDTKGAQPQVFNYNTADLPKSFTLTNGTILTIPAGAFTIGGVVANGPAVLEVTAFSKKGDMVLGGLNTLSDGNILESQGSFKLSQRITGLFTDETLAAGKFIKFEVPVPAGVIKPTQLFAGAVVDTGGARNQLNWVRANVPNQGQDVNPVNGKFTFNWGKLGWINCDVFNSFPGTKITLKVDLPNNPGTLANFRGSGNGNTFVYFIPKTINSAVQIYTHTTNTQVVSYNKSIPAGMQGVLLSFCIKDGQAWFAKKDITIGTLDMTESITLAPSTTDAIQAELNSMNGL